MRRYGFLRPDVPLPKTGVSSGEGHLDVGIHIGACIPDPGEAPTFGVIVQAAHEPRLDDVDLLELLAAGVHDLEVAVEIRLGRQGSPDHFHLLAEEVGEYAALGASVYV